MQAVQLSNAEISSTITATQVQNLPVLGRQVSTLFLTQAGVASGSNTTSVNGLRSSFSNVTLDGINIQDNFIRTNDLDYAPMRTTIDQIAEITVSTSNAERRDRRRRLADGALHQVRAPTRSTARVYWYNRNSALAANDWFNNQSGVEPHLPRPEPGGRRARRTHHQGQAVLLRQPRVLPQQAAVQPSAHGADRRRAQRHLHLPRRGRQHRSTKALSSLRSFTTDPTIKAMIAQLPATPNATGAGDGLNTAGYRFNARSNEFRDQFVYKGDYYLNAKHSFTGTYNYINNPTDRPDQGAFYTTIPPVSNTIKDHLLSLSWRWTVSPTLTNEAARRLHALRYVVPGQQRLLQVPASAGLSFQQPGEHLPQPGTQDQHLHRSRTTPPG